MKTAIAAVLSALALVVAVQVPAKPTRPRDILTFETMYGVDGPFVGEDHPIRDTNGDELPWTVAHGVHGRLTTDGHLKIHVRGLVFTNDDVVPPEKRGTNDEDFFRARVSCLSEQGDTVATNNVTTDGFPATTTGDADIDAQIELPDTCVAPIIFILAGSEEKWFAVTGFEK